MEILPNNLRPFAVVSKPNVTYLTKRILRRGERPDLLVFCGL